MRQRHTQNAAYNVDSPLPAVRLGRQVGRRRGATARAPGKVRRQRRVRRAGCGQAEWDKSVRSQRQLAPRCVRRAGCGGEGVRAGHAVRGS